MEGEKGFKRGAKSAGGGGMKKRKGKINTGAKGTGEGEFLLHTSFGVLALSLDTSAYR